MKQDLKLSEKLFCLSVNPSKGGIYQEAAAALNMTLPAAVLMELISKGILSTDNKRIHLANPSHQNDPIYEFFLDPVRKHGKDRRISSWISWYNLRARKIHKLFIRDLVQKNMIRVEERRFLFIPYDQIFLMDTSRVENMQLEIENVMLGKTEATEETTILAFMVSKTNLMRRILPDRAQRQIASLFIKKLPETQVSKAVSDAITMMNATVFIAASM